jgi:outer membrane protein TolC
VQAEALAAAQRALDIVSNQYKAGTVSYLNVITAQATALAAENTLTSVRNRQLLAVGQLLKNAAGRWDLPLASDLRAQGAP